MRSLFHRGFEEKEQSEFNWANKLNKPNKPNKLNEPYELNEPNKPNTHLDFPPKFFKLGFKNIGQIWYLKIAELHRNLEYGYGIY